MDGTRTSTIFGTEFAQHRLDAIKRGRDRLCHVAAVPDVVQAYPHAVQIGPWRHCEPARQAGRIGGIAPGDRGEHKCGVLGTACQRPDMIQALRKRQQAGAADTTVARLHAREPACRSRHPDRAAGIRAEPGEAEAGCDRYARARGGDARPVIGTPGISRRVDGRMMGDARPLGQLMLAQDHGARLPQATDNRSVPGSRRGVRAHCHAASRRLAGNVDQILNADRHAMKRPSRLPDAAFPVARASFGKRGLAIHRDVRAKNSVMRFDARQRLFGKPFRTGLARCHRGSGRDDRFRLLHPLVSYAGCAGWSCVAGIASGSLTLGTPANSKP